MTSLSKKQLDTLTTDAMFEGQRFAILAMFFYIIEEEKTKNGVVVKTYNLYSLPISYLRGGIGQLFIQEDKVGFLP